MSSSKRNDEIIDTLFYMEFALQQAKLSLDCLEVPVGELRTWFEPFFSKNSYSSVSVCVIVEDEKVITSGRNRTTETRNATRHAEMEAIDFLLEQWQGNGLSKEDVAKRFSKCSL